MTDKELLEWMQDLFQHSDDIERVHIEIDERIANILELLGYKESSTYYKCLITNGFYYS